MDKFKIPNQVSSSFLNRQRRKSDQLPLKDSNLLLPSQISIKKLPSSSNSLHKPAVFIRNHSARSQPNELNTNINLDLSRIKVCPSQGPSNLSARNANCHKKANSIYLRKRSIDGNLSDRLLKNENAKQLLPGPEVQMLCCNKFIERLPLYESKLHNFYNNSSR